LVGSAHQHFFNAIEAAVLSIRLVYPLQAFTIERTLTHADARYLFYDHYVYRLPPFFKKPGTKRA
jgi:hypothetical protein